MLAQLSEPTNSSRFSPEIDSDIEEDNPRRPSVAEERRALAEAGDVDAIWAILSNTNWTMLNLEDMFGLLLRALEVSGRNDPVGHSERLFQRMLAFVACLTMRSQYYIGRVLKGHDQCSKGGRAAIFLPHDLTQEHLGQILDLQNHLADLLESQARSARLWGLARRRAVPAPARVDARPSNAADERASDLNGSPRRSPPEYIVHEFDDEESNGRPHEIER